MELERFILKIGKEYLKSSKNLRILIGQALEGKIKFKGDKNR